LEAFPAIKLQIYSPSSRKETETSEIGPLESRVEAWETREAAATSLAPKVGEQVRLDPYSLNLGSLEDTEVGID
jgi:hypothetical protein